MSRWKTALRRLGLPALILAGAGLGFGASAAWRQLQGPPGIDRDLLPQVVADARSPLVLYATTQCPYCRQARLLLDELRVPYAVREIDTSAKARDEFRRLGGQAVPILVSAERAIAGFDEAAYRELAAAAQ